jgi:hypothetical protein
MNPWEHLGCLHTLYVLARRPGVGEGELPKHNVLTCLLLLCARSPPSMWLCCFSLNVSSMLPSGPALVFSITLKMKPFLTILFKT